MIQWMNENDGFLMAIITFVYVIATGLICYFNGKSAASSRKQIEEAQKQQKQNAGLQLYSLRKDVLNSLKKKEYNKIYWDVALLFDDEIFDSFSVIASKAEELEKTQLNIKVFEGDLFLLCPNPNASARCQEEILLAKEKQDYSRLKDEVITVLHRINTNESVDEHCEQYLETVKRSDELNLQIGGLSAELFLKMQKFIKESISIDREV